jgi:bifunctional non-homologous end joining protein LigD
MLRRSYGGLTYSELITSIDGPTIYEHACKLGLEGIVSKRIDSPYRSGKVKTWVKTKNPNSAAALRIEEGTF